MRAKLFLLLVDEQMYTDRKGWYICSSMGRVNGACPQPLFSRRLERQLVISGFGSCTLNNYPGSQVALVGPELPESAECLSGLCRRGLHLSGLPESQRLSGLAGLPHLSGW